MAVELRVVFEDSGQTADQIASAVASSLAGKAAAGTPVRGSSSGPDAGGPSTEVKGARKRKDDDPSVFHAVGSLGKMAAEATGFIGLLRSSQRLAEAFGELFRAVTRSSAAHHQEADAVGPSVRSQTETVDVTGPEVPQKTTKQGPKTTTENGEDFIEGEFSVKRGPKASDNALSIPGTSGMTGPVGSKVETVGVQETLAGVPAVIKPPVIGTPAAAGGATGTEAVAGAAGASAGIGTLGVAAIAVAAPLAALAASVVVVVGTLKKAFEILGPQVAKLESLNAPLGAAAAQSDIRMELAEIRRANQLGPDLAKFEKTRGRLEEATYDLQTKLLEVVTKFANAAEPLIDVVIKGMGVVEVSIPALVEVATLAFEASQLDLAGAKEAAAKLNKLLQTLPFEIARQLQDDDDDIGEDPMFAQFFGAVEGAKGRLPRRWKKLAPDAAGRFPALEDK